MKSIYYFSFLFLLAQACVPAETIAPSVYECALTTADPSEAHPQATEFEAAFAKMAANSFGGQVAARTPDGSLWTQASGMADIPNDIPLEACHLTMIGSISKPVTAVLVMQLHEEGLIDIDAPLNQYLSNDLIGEIEHANQVSVRQLLDHTSGIRDYLSTQQFLNSRNQDFLLETQEEKLRYAYGKSAYHAPGAQHTYSNTNYVLLGLLVEAVRQMTLWDAVDQYIAQPLGLENFQMGTHEQPIPVGTARPYTLSRGKYRDIYPFAVSDAATGDGGIASNMMDLITFIEGVFDGRLIQAATLEMMIQDRVAVPEEQQDFPQWEGETYGLGLLRMNTPHGIAYGHTGSTSTYNAFLFHWPEQGASFAVGYHAGGDTEDWDARRDFRMEMFDLMLE
ncbi:MAG: serine hydrolase domain-containing protein [Bacteroidota bacterium]